MNDESFDMLGRHETLLVVSILLGTFFQFLKGVAIFTNLLLQALEWDRTPTRLLGVLFYPELAIQVYHFWTEISSKSR